MKTLFCVLLSLFLYTATFAQQIQADDILGTWMPSSGKAHVKIEKSGNRYMGRISWLKDPLDENGKTKVDDENPDDRLKTQPILGLKLLNNFSYDEDGEWEDGTIYDPENGKTYSCIISMDNKDVLNVRGYIGISLIGRTDVWKRVKN